MFDQNNPPVAQSEQNISPVTAGVLSEKKTINAGGRLIDFEKPRVMGILNITPDSFYSGSRMGTSDHTLKVAEQMLKDGADFLDIGAYSSRPGAEDVSPQDELDRLLPVIRTLAREFPQAILSVDTFRANIAEASVKEGAHIINDISGGELDPDMFSVAAALKVPYILMHMKGTPQTMKHLTSYNDILSEVFTYFSAKIAALKELGVTDIIADPGFGFAKTIDQNYYLLKNLDLLNVMGIPVLAGLSRKSMVWKVLNITNEEALNGTTVLNTFALLSGASILRVHDVKAAAEAVILTEKLKRSSVL